MSRKCMFEIIPEIEVDEDQEIGLEIDQEKDLGAEVDHEEDHLVE